MVTFDVALVACKQGYYIKCPSGLNKWLHYNQQIKQLVHSTKDFNNLTWVPNQYELLADDWEIK